MDCKGAAMLGTARQGDGKDSLRYAERRDGKDRVRLPRTAEPSSQ